MSAVQKRASKADGPPLFEQAFLRLRSDVLSGFYEAEAKLKVETLRAAYGYSSSPIREALSRLAQEGLVRADERRGFRVAPITVEDLTDITQMRLTLDPQALAAAMRHGDDRWEAEIVMTFYRLEKVETRHEIGPISSEWSSLHRAFHMALLSAAPSARLRHWSASLFDQAERYRRYSASRRKEPRRKSNEHKVIMDAVLKRDESRACDLLREHIMSTQHSVEAALKQDTSRRRTRRRTAN